MRNELVENFLTQEKSYEYTVEFKNFLPEYYKKTIYDIQRFSPFLTVIKGIIDRFFTNISYLGPLRDTPHPYYFNDDDSILKIGNKGEYAAHILAKFAKDEIKYNKIITLGNDEGLEYYEVEESLEKAVKYWICDVFEMAKDIKVNKYHDESMYIIEIKNFYDLKIPITQVGFGISQVLPIVVEGLKMKPGGILILEQPEIHLHPKVQSLLFDFLFSLSESGKMIVIETHSDHFITRLRRRVAEDLYNKTQSKINLTFIETGDNYPKYYNLNLSDLGTLTYWPKGFFDQLDYDIRAIVKAQGRKRKLKNIGDDNN